MDDSRIWATLGPLYPDALEDLPVDGEWLEPPFADDDEGRAIVLNDGDFQFVVVDRAIGSVLYVCEDDVSIMASSLETMDRIVRMWGSIDRDVPGPERDEEFAQVTKVFETELQRIDPRAAARNEFWHLYTEELTSADYGGEDDELDEDELESDDDLEDELEEDEDDEYLDDRYDEGFGRDREDEYAD
ncbi:SUKH-4 family immunity protein [Specibacter cremeus]|uniref:SUKH-4 family immunity protein n=1 Tax=Specibacter cremeus TaxID=1629051 RepID=UPI0013DDFCA0|nr:SUKH-4 family immunity protein [Specibacter cremeus]